MNIWYFSAHDQPKGKSSRTYDFAYQLTKRGHNVTIFTNSYCHWTHEDRLDSSDKWSVEMVDGIRIVWLRTFHYKGNGWQRGVNMLTNMLRALQSSASFVGDSPDVVVGPSVPIGTGWAALRIAQNKGSAFVYEIRDVWPIALIDDGGLSKSSLIYYIFRYMEKLLYRKSDCISATMPYVQEHVARSGGDPKRVYWIPNGVNFDRFIGYDFYRGGGTGFITAMYIGGFGAAHDVITIVRAAKILQQKGSNTIRFIVIGDGPKRFDCIQEAQQNGLDNIEFRDSVPKSEVPKLQMEADILIACVLDSKAYRFGLNLNKVYDYFASGRPVVFCGNATNDLVKEADAGYSVPPEDPEALVKALLDYLVLPPVERISMGKKGQDYIRKEFDMINLGRNMELLLVDAIENKNC